MLQEFIEKYCLTFLQLAQFVRLALVLIFIATVSTATFAAVERGGLRGKVTDVKGKAVEGAKVTVEREGAAAVTVTSNAKGEFTFSDLEPGEYLISVDAEGYKGSQLLKRQKVESGKTTKLNGEIVLESSRASTLLRGAVFTEKGFSLPGAKVEIERVDSGEKFRKQYVTNDAGAFAFRLPDNGGQYKLTASAHGFETASQTVDVSAGESRSLAFSLKPSGK